MPLTVEAVVAYLGIILAGCAAVSIADSFAAAEIASRLRIANAAGIITQVLHSCTHTYTPRDRASPAFVFHALLQSAPGNSK